MSKKSRSASTGGGWSRYPVQLAGIRISTELSTAIAAKAAAKKMRPSAFVRDALEAVCGLSAAQPAAHFAAPTA